jgi:hypothetical protein
LSKVSHFQIYSQKENHVTNNTLLVLSHFYQTSPLKLQGVLSSLIDEDFAIGVSFEQQVRGGNSVLDARIQQRPLLIGLETKLYDNLWDDQIERHVNNLASQQVNGAVPYLMALTKEPIPMDRLQRLEAYAKDKRVIFMSVTFSQMIESLRATCADYEQILSSILEDYEAFIGGEGLLDDRANRVAIFPCGTTYQENERFHLYYEGPERPKRSCKFIGIYRNKVVSLIGEIRTVLVGSLVGDQWQVAQREQGTETVDQLRRIDTVVKETSYYDLTGLQRFYLADKFYETNLVKRSKGSMRGCRYLAIRDLLGAKVKCDQLSAKDLAERLSGLEFD